MKQAVMKQVVKPSDSTEDNVVSTNNALVSSNEEDNRKIRSTGTGTDQDPPITWMQSMRIVIMALLISLGIVSLLLILLVIQAKAIPQYEFSLDSALGIYYKPFFVSFLWLFRFPSAFISGPVIMYMLLTYSLLGHEGSPSHKKIVFVCLLQLLILIVFYIILHIMHENASSVALNCEKTGGIYKIIDYFLIFGVNGFGYPALSSYLLARGIKTPARSNWIRIVVLYVVALVFYFVCTRAPALIVYFNKLESDVDKVIFRLVYFPLITQVGMHITRFNTSKVIYGNFINDPKKEGGSDNFIRDYVFNLPFLTMASMYSRFFQTSMSSVSTTVLLSLAVGLQEIIIRLSWRLRVKLLYRVKLSKDETEKLFSGSTNHHCRCILSETIVEYVGCFIAPLITLLHESNNVHIQAGYEYNSPFSTTVPILVASAVSNVFVELLVDLICLRYEEKSSKLPIKRTWDTLTSKFELIRGFLPSLLITITFSFFFMTYGFYVPQNRFISGGDSNECYFVKECVPYVCNSNCFVPAIGNSNTTSIAPASFTLPPVLKEACLKWSEKDADLINWPIFNH